MTQYEIERAERQKQWAESYKERSAAYYKSLEDRGINTSVKNIQRDTEDMDIDFIWSRLCLRGN